MRRYGVNGLLMEYEDMFPYEGNLANLSAEYCYNRVELKKFLRKAKQSGFEIIPLIQTFGHLEYALKLAEFQHLREDPLYPDSICPSKIESLLFLEELIKQIICFHETVTALNFVHIGCDEVFHLNQCQQCKERLGIINNQDLLLQHVRFISEVVNSLSAKTTILIWDDMLRDIKAYVWLNIEPFNNVHPVYWDYGSTLRVTHKNLYAYHKNFPHIWIASAYKGADGRISTMMNVRERFLNNFRWMRYILDYKFGGEASYTFNGIILTGWSRYSHMDPPCELLPVSIPSLVLNLLVIQNFKSGFNVAGINNERVVVENFFREHINVELNKSFKCLTNYDNLDFSVCKFEGQELYKTMIQYILMKKEISKELSSESNAIATLEYYSEQGSINMNNVLEIKEYIVTKLDYLKNLENLLVKEISKYYHYDFAKEYTKYKSFQTKNKLTKLLNILNNYMQKRIWNRRTVSKISNVSTQGLL
ncbi:hypothetical protein evm_007101 [Chilo suppressalis]|nr:hypothetical protein evm_007101 [Chilo suppressalis]